MSLLLLALLLAAMNGELGQDAEGTISGVVLNGSQESKPVANADVQLRAGALGVFDPVASTKTDAQGRFSFENILLDPAITYLPGANQDGVHYPSKRVHMDSSRRVADVTIVVFNAVHAPSPLCASRHDVSIHVDERLMTITETLLVSNPSQSTYVGQSQGDRGPVTLRLTIPENFDKVTFHREFFGRRFRIIDHRLVTDLPWPPGDKELQFTYRIPLQEGAGRIRRPLDLPSSNVRIRVRSRDGDNVECNLPRLTSVGSETEFASMDRQLQSGHIIDLQIGNAPLPWMRYAQWSSLAFLCVLVAGTVVTRHRRARQTSARRELTISTGKRPTRSPSRSRRVA